MTTSSIVSGVRLQESRPISLPIHWARMAQFIVLSIIALDLILHIYGIPIGFAMRHTPCSVTQQGYCIFGQFEAPVLQDWQARGISVTAVAILVTTLGLIWELLLYFQSILLIWRKPHDLMALACAILFATCATHGDGIGTLSQVLPEIAPLRLITGTINGMLLLPFFFVFPTGKFSPRWVAPFVLSTSAISLLYSIYMVVAPLEVNTFRQTQLFSIIGLYFLVLNLAMIVVQLYRYRRQYTPQQKQQTKWVLYGVFLSFIPSLLLRLPSILQSELASNGVYILFGYVINLTGAIICFACIAIALLRHRLFDIDVIINRTLVYGSLSALVVALYVLLVNGVGALLRVEANLPVSLLATGVVAVLFQPMRWRIQRSVNRLMFGQRDEPVKVLSDLGKRLDAALTPEAVLPGICETLATALKLPYVAIESLSPNQSQTAENPIAAHYGQTDGALTRLPLIYQSQLIGYLVVAPRSRGDTFNAADLLILENIARQTGAALHAARLTDDLQDSRQRLVTAREEERRRLRRDLHDGLGPVLATLTLQAEAARDFVSLNPVKSEALLGDIIEGTQSALADIRRVVYALRPPALDDLGLVSALKEQAAHYTSGDLTITVEAPPQLPPLPAAVEVAAYRIVQEALTNVTRHAEARTCQVCLRVNGSMEIEVADDGKGIPATRRAGVGLNSMHERAAELGGSCEIASEPGKGTHIKVLLPQLAGQSGG